MGRGRQLECGQPPTHIVLRGQDDTGKDLIIAGDYIAQGLRHRAAELATEWLGPRTELEIQQAIAWAPWLGHLMVSRHETARPLLTPGEVMQLPPDDEVVMVSGHPPIKVQKIRYYLDANFKSREQAPPSLLLGRYADAPPSRPDDWTGLAIPAALIPGSVRIDRGVPIDDGGCQQQPELAEVMFTQELEHVVDEFGLLDDDDLSLHAQLDPRLQRTARLAAHDPDDGISL